MFCAVGVEGGGEEGKNGVFGGGKGEKEGSGE